MTTRPEFVQGFVSSVSSRVPISASGPTLLLVHVPEVRGTGEIVRQAAERLGRANLHLRSFVETRDRTSFLGDPAIGAYALACFQESDQDRAEDSSVGALADEHAGRARREMVDAVIELLMERDDELEKRGGTVLLLAMVRSVRQTALRDRVVHGALAEQGYGSRAVREREFGCSGRIVEVYKLVHFSGDAME